MKFSDQRIRKLVNDYPDNTTRAMSSIALDYDIPYNRVYRAVHKKIPLRTARAMVRAGLPLSRSELRGNEGNLPRTQFDYVNSQIIMALKNLKKRNYNDEMIESVSLKKRPGHPRDFIIIVKHRYFVNGARVYSAGLKTEDTIENFVPIIGKKTKRVGKSDYVFNVYGVRYPRDVKQKLGKLFGNPKSFPNIEKSGFHKGQYVGYSPKAVNFFSITREYRGWKAIGQIYKTNPPGTAWKIIYGKDLAEISKALENL